MRRQFLKAYIVALATEGVFSWSDDTPDVIARKVLAVVRDDVKGAVSDLVREVLAQGAYAFGDFIERAGRDAKNLFQDFAAGIFGGRK